MMAIHMFNHMWQAKVELHGSVPVAQSNSSSASNTANDSALKTYNDTREKILTTLIEKGEKLKQDSQLQSAIKPRGVPNPKTATPKPTGKKPGLKSNKQSNLRNQNSERKIKQKHVSVAKSSKPKKKSNGMLAKVKTKIPLKRKNKFTPKHNIDEAKINSPRTAEDSLLDDPNHSAIIVSPGFVDNIDNSIIKAHADLAKDPQESGLRVHKVLKNPNESGVTVHKTIKERDHEKQEPGSNTIIMKLASSTGKRPKGKLTIPEQCQDAINLLTQQFPGYDMVAIRHMAAEKVGVSPQYIENLNILPDKSA